ncbi:glycogen synthase kinase-3 alpha [Drosophila simulans]|uniref:Protein kinase domain-containing protein n=2 Tax=Drosophila simulans TaxID=7240 RepID=A0A0J9R2G3_DROSI|nr:glycogen synthase kinase-3 alpha [Drosophila simulans]KMY90014.1 uncharacterized protein Dsimw501_GD23865 [Drosophila simulans]
MPKKSDISAIRTIPFKPLPCLFYWRNKSDFFLRLSLKMENKEKKQKPSKRHSQIPLIIPKNSVISSYAVSRLCSEPALVRIEVKELIGSGSFGRVYRAHINESEELVAVKQTLYNPKLTQREAEIMGQLMEHNNIVRLIMHSSVSLGYPSVEYVLLVMEYMPMTLRDYINYHLPLLQHTERVINVRILSYQMFRGLGYLHLLGISHRDIKPGNLLIDNQTMVLKLSDFGSAKQLVPQEPSTSYICSRLYRAPELFAGHELYSCAVDIWSAGCVLAELFKGYPLFSSHKHDRKQLKLIVNTLGTDGLERAPEILSKCGNSLHPRTTRPSWNYLLNAAVPQDLCGLLNVCFIYEAAARISPMMACGHSSYDELRIMDALGLPMPNGNPLPPLFNFNSQEMGTDPKLWVQILPIHLASMEDKYSVVEVFEEV